MAQVPYNDGVPSVAPETRPPDDYQHIRAEPDQFGALIGQGLEKAGKGVEQAGENVFDAIKFQNNTDANDQVNHFDTARNHIATGDPSKTTMGADGKPVPDMGYFGLEGRPALDKREDAIKALNDAREEGRKNLKNPAAQLEYDRQTRRMYTEYESKINSHAEAQYKTWAGGVNQKGALNSLNDFTNHLDNPEEMSHHARDYIDFKVKASQLKFGDDPTINRQVIDQSKRELLEAQTSAVAVKDPAAALRILEKNKDIAGTQYDEMYGKLRSRALDQTAAQKTGEIIAKTRGGTFSRPVEGAFTNVAERYGLNPDMLKQTAKIESGGNPNAHDRGSSYKGLFQLSDGEFRKYGPQGGNIWSPQDNTEAAAAKMKAEGDQFATNFGRQPTGFDHYMIHQQGLAGYSSHLANPNAPAWQNMLSTGEGRQKGERWARSAIWGNIPDQYKASFGSVDNVTSRDFLNMWAAKFGGGSAPQFTGTGGVNVMSPLSNARLPAPQPVQPVAWHFPESESATGQGRAAYEQAAFPVPNVASMIKPNVIQQVLDDPEAQADPQLMTKMLRDANQTLAAQEIAENQKTSQKKAAVDHAAGTYTTRIWDAQHTPNFDWVKLAGEINHDPALADAAEVKEHLMERVMKRSGEEQSLLYGPGYFEMKQAVLSEPGTPGHIGDITQIYRRPIGDLTASGEKELIGVMSAIKKSPDEYGIQKARGGIEAYARQYFVNEDFIPGTNIRIGSKKGELLFNGSFLPQFQSAYAEWVKGGKDPYQFLTTKNIDEMIRRIYPADQRSADRLSEGAERPGGEETPNAPLPPAPEGIEDTAWKSVMAKTPPLANGAPMSHKLWGEMIGDLNENPTPQVMASFDKHFGRFGFSAKDVLGKINPAAAKAAQMTGHIGDTTNLGAADKEMHLTPQEKALYERHLDNLTGPGGVDNADGSRSSLFQAVEEHNGKFYNIPTVWNGKIETEPFTRKDGSVMQAPNKTALENVGRVGWDKFPSYATPEEADERYEQMHKFMERDTENYLKGRARPQTKEAPPAKPAPIPAAPLTGGPAQEAENTLSRLEGRQAHPVETPEARETRQKTEAAATAREMREGFAGIKNAEPEARKRMIEHERRGLETELADLEKNEKEAKPEHVTELAKRGLERRRKSLRDRLAALDKL